MHEQACCQWTCQSPVAHSCSLLNHSNSFHRGMFKLNIKFDADLLLYLLSHFECDDHTVHMFIQLCLLPPLTITVRLSLFMHAHSSPLSLASGYIDVMQTILIILTMAGLFLDTLYVYVYTHTRTHIYIHTYTHTHMVWVQPGDGNSMVTETEKVAYAELLTKVGDWSDQGLPGKM